MNSPARGGAAGPSSRAWLLVLFLFSTAGARAAGAQDTAAVRLEVSLTQDSLTTGTRDPLIRLEHLLADPRWLDLLRSGFPLRLHYRAALWRVREGWFDLQERDFEWDVVVRHEPLLDQYTVTRLAAGQRRENRYATLGALEAALAFAYRIAIGPRAPGTWYYVANLKLTALADSDLDDLGALLEEDPAGGGRGENAGSAVGRGARRLVLRLAGMPSLSLDAQSARFSVGGGGP